MMTDERFAEDESATGDASRASTAATAPTRQPIPVGPVPQLPPPGLLADRLTVVTGAAQGIGAAIAEAAALAGSSVVLVDINAERLVTSAKAIRQIIARTGRDQGQRIESACVDVTRQGEVDAFGDDIESRFGSIDGLVNNVGHYVRSVGEFADGGPGHWQDLYEVNLLHMFLMTHRFVPLMKAGTGSIVNVSSAEGLRGYGQDPVYGAFKAAAVHFTRSLGVQLGYSGVRVNGIAPDVTETPQVPYGSWVPESQTHLWPVWVPVGRVGVPADQAAAVLFLLSDLSAFITGHTLPTDGGTVAAGGWFRSASRSGRSWTNRPVES